MTEETKKRTPNREFMVLLTNFLSEQFKSERVTYHSVQFTDAYDKDTEGQPVFIGYLLRVRMNVRDSALQPWTTVRFYKDEPIIEAKAYQTQFPYHKIVIALAIEQVIEGMEVAELLEKKKKEEANAKSS